MNVARYENKWFNMCTHRRDYELRTINTHKRVQITKKDTKNVHLQMVQNTGWIMITKM